MSTHETCLGHERIVKVLKQLFQKKQMGHAYLFSGPRHVGKHAVASMLLDCLPSKEVIYIERAIDDHGKQVDSISIDQIRDVIHALSLSLSDDTSYRMICIDDAETLTREAGNALLKSLEEPPERTVFIFFEHASGRVLPTIRSRCCTIRFPLVQDISIRIALNEQNISHSKSDTILQLSAGRPGTMHALLADDALEDIQKRIALLQSYGDGDIFLQEHAKMLFQKEDEEFAELAMHQQIQYSSADEARYRMILSQYDAFTQIRIRSNAHVYQPGLMESFL